MAISPAVILADISATDATSYTTATLAASAHYNELITLVVASRTATGDPNIPTLTTARGLNIASVGTRLVSADSARLTVFRTCIASGGGSGSLVIDFAGQTQSICAWELLAWTGTAATAANNGSDGIGVTAGNTSGSNGTSVSSTLAALQGGSATFAATIHDAAESTTQGTGWSEISELKTSPISMGFETQWNSVGSTAVSATWTTNGHPRIQQAMEILLGAAVGETDFAGTIPL